MITLESNCGPHGISNYHVIMQGFWDHDWMIMVQLENGALIDGIPDVSDQLVNNRI